MDSQRRRRFGAGVRMPKCRAQALRIVSGKEPGPRRVKKAGHTGLWYVATRRECRSLTRGFARMTRCVLAAVPEACKPVSPSVRKSMKGNKSKDTKPELLVRKRLREEGLTGYRLQWKAPGRPDIAWPGKRVALDVRGCFWHKCPHCHPPTPKTNQEYWGPKLERNVERDAQNLAALEADGWRVHVIWECELKKKAVEYTFMKLIPELKEELGK